MLLVERRRGRGVAVALLGHRQRDNHDGWVSQRVEQRFRIFRRDQDVLQCADDLQALAVRSAHGQRVEPILRLECIAHRGRT